MIHSLLLAAVAGFCLQPGDAAFFNVLPAVVESGFRPENTTVRFQNLEIPLPEDGTVLVASGLLDKPDKPLKLLLSEDNRQISIEIPVCPREFPVQRLTLPEEMVRLSPQVLQRVKEENEMLNKLWNRCTYPLQWKPPFYHPLPGFDVKDNFGDKRIINGEPRSPHTGVDIPAPAGTPVHAFASGTVVLTRDLFFSGLSIVIDHGGCLYTMYFHLSRFAVREGEKVQKGDIIGYVGSTGRATGPHLHFGVRYAGKRVNPLTLLRPVLINY